MSESGAPGAAPPPADDRPGTGEAEDGAVTGDRMRAAGATLAVVAGVALAVVGISNVATLLGRVEVGVLSLLPLVGLPLGLGVSLAALGAVHGGVDWLPGISLSPTRRQRRAVVFGTLLVLVDAAGRLVPVLAVLFVLGAGGGGSLLSPLVVGWTLAGAGLAGAALPTGDRVPGVAVAGRTYDRVAGATAGPFPTALRGLVVGLGVLAVVAGVLVVAGAVVAGCCGGGDAMAGVVVLLFVTWVLVVLGGLAVAVGLALPDRSRVPSPPPAQRVAVLLGASVAVVVPLPLWALPLGPSGGSAIRLGTATVLAGLCWWAVEAVAGRL